jgi:pyruvate ferredoxin oxidoreductase delta subunit
MVEITKGAVISDAGSSRNHKTGAWRTYIPTIDKNKCIACGKCWSVCPDACIRKKDGKFEINHDYCKGCLLCEKACPVKAITSEVEEK